MATYTYTCDNEECEMHGSMKDIQQKMADDAFVTCASCMQDTFRRAIVTTAGGHRIGGVLNSTSMFNVSGDPGPRRKNYDCDPMN